MIREKRIRMHITQKQLAQRLGVSQAFVSKIESDKFINITLIEIKKLSKVLQLDELEVCKYFLDKYNNSI